ncbi:sodium-coupled monocarboxylate transporter 1-like [Mya arenaria]|uniref:sodium-coupled monocarboxylate transporter 1-like n=1 Tax=Mya arenaria TaxID=6604 RepID=UPI0022E6BAF2|nr:sodium-coupled monocarboxylate transporter 1-like [Mya arenaria]
MATQGLNVADYVVMAIFVGISSLIGFYYGLCTKQRTTEEYLLGGRRMHLLPVAISLAVTFQSAISIMGTSAEIYMYHTMGTYGDIGFIMATIFQAFAIVPLMHPLKLTSSYEYLYLRFESRAVQLLATVLGMLQTLLYISIVLFTPALALEAGRINKPPH